MKYAHCEMFTLGRSRQHTQGSRTPKHRQAAKILFEVRIRILNDGTVTSKGRQLTDMTEKEEMRISEEQLTLNCLETKLEMQG